MVTKKIIMKQVILILLLIPSLLFAQQTINDSIYLTGTYRHFTTYIPALYNPSEPTPLVFNLHGRTSNAAMQIGRKNAENN